MGTEVAELLVSSRGVNVIINSKNFTKYSMSLETGQFEKRIGQKAMLL